MLEPVLKLLADPSRWTKRADARDAEGKPVPYDSWQACSWCLYGAIYRVFDREQRAQAVELLKVHVPVGQSLAQFNDYATHDELVAVLRRAVS